MPFRGLVKLVIMAAWTMLLVLPTALARAAGLFSRHPINGAALHLGGLWSRWNCRILGLRVDVTGTPPRGRYVLVANHLSYLDIWVLQGLCPSVFVAKREIAAWPGFGWVARLAGVLFVDRQKRGDVVRVGRQMTDRLEAGFPLTLFPEGRATAGEEVLPFGPSLLEPAASTGTECYGATLSYDTSDPSIVPGPHICWYDSAPFYPHFIRLASARDLRASVRFTSEPVRSADRKELARQLRDAVAENFTPVRQEATCAP